MENRRATQSHEGHNKLNGDKESRIISGSNWSLQNISEIPVFGSNSRLELSHLSSLNSSFEALGGNSSYLDPLDLQMEISDLGFQVQSLKDDCQALNSQVGMLQEENLQLMSQKEDLEKKLSHRDLAQERIKQLQRELDDAKHAISSTEDLNCVLSYRIQRLERDYSDMEMKQKELKRENDITTSELERALLKLRQKDKEVERVKLASEEVVSNWISKEKWLEDQLNSVNEVLDELNRTNNQLRKEKFELESSLVDLSGNQLNFLNTASNGGSSATTEGINSPVIEEELQSLHLRRSLHAEISATMERRRSLLQPLFGCESYQDTSTQCNLDELELEPVRDPKPKTMATSILETDYLQLLPLLNDMRQLIFQGSSDKQAEGGGADVEAALGAIQDQKLNAAEDETNNVDVNLPFSSQDDVVRRINEELADFRQQLKKSQDIFHALQANGGSAHALSSVTKSCPVLADKNDISASTVDGMDGDRSKFVCCSTQTDPFVMEHEGRRPSTHHDGPVRSLLDAIDDMDGDGDSNYLDKLSDDISYRLTINLPTVLEESELETETSPCGGLRRMSSCDKGGGRPKLMRMPNATEDGSVKGGSGEDPDGLKSDNDFQSATSSLPGSLNASAYNSLERPLQLTGAYEHHRSSSMRNGDNSDTASIVSDGNTTFGSPISSPSSPTYWTPSQGSSSQETITNHDGDKTPVNDEDALENYEVRSCPVPSGRREFENGEIRKRVSSFGPTIPVYNNGETFSTGVIPESQREHMIKYAYDPVTRRIDKDAQILSGSEWRTLRKDLDKQAQDNYRKRFAQEEGNDVEGGHAMETGSQQPYNSTDLDEEAEEYLEMFPNVIEALFENLDVIKSKGKGPTESELEAISKRFNHLADTFKTEHINLAQRIELKLKEHDTSQAKMKDIIDLLLETLQNLEDSAKLHKVPEDILHRSSKLKNVAGDIEMHTLNLSKTSRRVGMMDVQIRLYKMIEVMVLYVNILRNLYENKEKELQTARTLLSENNIPFTGSKSVAKLNNNNNNEKVSWTDGQFGQGQEQSNENGKPKEILQHLLGPKKSNDAIEYNKLRENLVLKEKKSSTNIFIRYVADTYEALRCELFWPWSWEETWKGIKQGFSIVLMLFGLLIILTSVIPIVSANSDCHVNDLTSIFQKHGDLRHPGPPPV